MKRQQPRETVSASTEQPQGPFDTARRLRHLLGVGSQELLSVADIAQQYASIFPSTEAARKWIHRHAVPCRYRGRLLVIDRRDLEAAFKPVRKAS